MTPLLRKRIDFENFDIVYPAVPKKTNTYVQCSLYVHGRVFKFMWHNYCCNFFIFRHDCGIFSVMYMKHWTPSTPISNLFTQADIDNIRIKLANELYFSTFNSADKSFVTNFFGDVSLVSDFCCFIF